MLLNIWFVYDIKLSTWLVCGMSEFENFVLTFYAVIEKHQGEVWEFF